VHSAAPSLTLSKQSDHPVHAEILLDGGTLVVCGVWDKNGNRQPGLYRIYHRLSGLCIGPYYAELGLAEKGMKKALTLHPYTWSHPIEWYQAPERAWIRKWMDEQLGTSEDIVGGYWAPPDPVHVCHWPGCGKPVPPRMWGCGPHWFRLPKHLRSLIWKTYAPGQEITKKPSRAYLEAARQVQEWIEGQKARAR